jgi:hypothetical protein
MSILSPLLAPTHQNGSSATWPPSRLGKLFDNVYSVTTLLPFAVAKSPEWAICNLAAIMAG